MARTSLDPGRASPARPFPRQLRFATASSAAQTPSGPASEDETQRWSWCGKGKSFARVPSLDSCLSAIYAAGNHLSVVRANFLFRTPRRCALPRLRRRRFAIANAIEADLGRDQQPSGPENRHLTCGQWGHMSPQVHGRLLPQPHRPQQHVSSLVPRNTLRLQPRMGRSFARVPSLVPRAAGNFWRAKLRAWEYILREARKCTVLQQTFLRSRAQWAIMGEESPEGTEPADKKSPAEVGIPGCSTPRVDESPRRRIRGPSI
jgi:hypothetical protein